MTLTGASHPPAKRVQQLSMAGDEPPQRFIVRKNMNTTPSPPLAHNIHIVDLSLLTKESSAGEQEEYELYKIRSALSSWGCFQAIGHGISNNLLDNVRDLTKNFFALPIEEKEKYSRSSDGIQGYGNDPILSENQVLDWSDRLFLQILPEDERNLKFWPQNPSDFSELLHEYCTKMELMTQLILVALAKSLRLEADSFLKQFGGRAQMHARFNFYPICSKPDRVLGSKEHSDGSGITILLQDEEVEGLQVLKEDKWYRVGAIPHAFVVNVGDQLQIMSNGIFKSPLHKVVANSLRERISLAVFYIPYPDEEIEPAQGLIDKERPQMYHKVKNYAAINFECFQNGTIALDKVKIT